jgi:putative transposase
LKGRTAAKLFEEFPHIKEELWGRHFWSRGYFCVTVGELNEENIKEYLEHHFEKENTEGFRVEC